MTEDLEGIEENLDDVSILVIGDPHLRSSQISVGIEFCEKCIELSERLKPNIIIVLGDILDTHEVLRTQPKNLAEKFILDLSKISKTFLLIGNHDYINNQQFLTENHPFHLLKFWDKVTIVDKPILAEVGMYKFVMCPYVPLGRFIEALDTLKSKSIEWEEVDAIFAHQEIRGCKFGSPNNEEADYWNPDHPTLISGHIHIAQKVGSNVYYPGSGVQVTFADESEKRIWLINFSEEMNIEKYDLKIKGRITKYIKISEVQEKVKHLIELCKSFNVRLELSGTKKEITLFKKEKCYKKLTECITKIIFDTIEELEDNKIKSMFETQQDKSYLEILEELIKDKGDNVMQAFKSLNF